MPWWGWLIIGLAVGLIVGGAVGYAESLFQLRKGLGVVREAPSE